MPILFAGFTIRRLQDIQDIVLSVTSDRMQYANGRPSLLQQCHVKSQSLGALHVHEVLDAKLRTSIRNCPDKPLLTRG